MTDRRAGNTRQADGLRFTFQAEGYALLLDRIGVIKLAENEPADLPKNSRETQMREHPVDAISFLARIFQEQNCAAKIGRIRRPQQPQHTSHVAAPKPALHLAGNDGFDFGIVRGGEEPAVRWLLLKGTSSPGALSIPSLFTNMCPIAPIFPGVKALDAFDP